MQVGKLITEYPPSIETMDAEVKYRLENWEDYYNEGVCPEEEEVQEHLTGDSFFFETAHEETCEAIDVLMKRKSMTGYWYAEVKNFGWMSTEGHKAFEAATGKKLLEEILPDTDCHFKVYRYGTGFAINNAHHDSSMWKEWYYILPISCARYERERVS